MTSKLRGHIFPLLLRDRGLKSRGGGKFFFAVGALLLTVELSYSLCRCLLDALSH